MQKKMMFIAALFLLFFSALPAKADSSQFESPKLLKQEIEMGKKAEIELEKHMPRVLDPNKEAHLSIIANKLIPYYERKLNYNVRILELKEPNAFSLPGGTTYISTGMLSFLKSDDEIAAILAHEFAHADKAHVIIQNKKSNKLNILTLIGLLAATQGVGPPALLVSNAVQTAIINTYSIEMEKEADAIGIDVMYKAGFNPTAMLTTIERLKIQRLKKAHVDPGIFQTHPEDDERISSALKYMKENNLEVNRRGVSNILKIDIVKTTEKIVLNIDENQLLALKNTSEAEGFISKIADRLDKYIELELAPFDIRVGELNGEEALLIKGNCILTISERERIQEVPEVHELREKINEIINMARRENPISNYFQ